MDENVPKDIKPSKKKTLSEEAYKHMLEYQYKYNKRVYKQYQFRLNIRKDQEMIEFLAEKPSWQKYVLELIRKDMNSGPEK